MHADLSHTCLFEEQRIVGNMSPNCHNGSIDRYYVYNDWSHDPPTQCDLNAIARERALHPNAQRLPSKLNRMLGDPGEGPLRFDKTYASGLTHAMKKFKICPCIPQHLSQIKPIFLFFVFGIRNYVCIVVFTRPSALPCCSALSGVIVWKPHGRSWQIEDRNEFRRIALPSYFQHSNVASFIRLVNAWGWVFTNFCLQNHTFLHGKWRRHQIIPFHFCQLALFHSPDSAAYKRVLTTIHTTMRWGIPLKRTISHHKISSEISKIFSLFVFLHKKYSIGNNQNEKLFLRGKPHLHVRMRRLTSCDRKDPLEISGQCPDFFNMPVCVGETHVSSCEDGAEAMEQRDMPLQTSTIIASTSGSTDLSFSQRSDYKTTGNENHQEARIIESQGASPAQFLRDTPNQIQQPILCCQRSFLDSTEWTNPHSVPCAMPKNLGSFFHGEQLEQMTPSNQVQYQTILSRHRINTDPNRNNPSFLQQEACPLYFTLLDSSLLASTTTNTSRRSRSQDRLIGYLANTLYPRVQTVGPPRNNEELIQLLISEWQASPDTGQGDDYQRLQRILANRRFRATNAFDEHIWGIVRFATVLFCNCCPWDHHNSLQIAVFAMPNSIKKKISYMLECSIWPKPTAWKGECWVIRTLESRVWHDVFNSNGLFRPFSRYDVLYWAVTRTIDSWKQSWGLKIIHMNTWTCFTI